MADAGSSQGLNKLAQVMQERMKRNQEANGSLVLDFGAIQADMSLKTNTFSIPIPRADYHVCRQLTLGTAGSLLTETKTPGQHGGHMGGDGSHSHQIKVPEKMRSIKPGDRVLVAWVQSEAVVIDIILRGTEV
jgi:hypothetical protein